MAPGNSLVPVISFLEIITFTNLFVKVTVAVAEESFIVTVCDLESITNPFGALISVIVYLPFGISNISIGVVDVVNSLLYDLSSFSTLILAPATRLPFSSTFLIINLVLEIEPVAVALFASVVTSSV